MEREKISLPLSPVHIAHLFEFHLSYGLNEPNIRLLSEKYMKKSLQTNHNRLFAASHSRGTKPPCWRAKVALGQDKQRKLLV